MHNLIPTPGGLLGQSTLLLEHAGFPATPHITLEDTQPVSYFYSTIWGRLYYEPIFWIVLLPLFKVELYFHRARRMF